MTESKTREQEIAHLAAEQRADDTPRQRAERHGGEGGGVPVLSIAALGLTQLSTDLDGVSVSGTGLGQAYDEANGPARNGRHKQQRLGALWANVEDADSDAARIVRAAVADMTDEQRETFRLVFGERLSYRAAAEQLSIDVSSVRDRVETLKRIVTRALVTAAGGEDA